MKRIKVAALFAASMMAAAGCDAEGEPGNEDAAADAETELEGDDESAKTGEAEYDPTQFCLDNGSHPDGPFVGPAALGDNVLGTAGRADGFGNENWGAEYGAELSLKGVQGGPHGTETRVRGELVGRATAYDLSADVVRIALDGHSAADGDAAFDANLTLLDRYTYPLFSYEGDFSDEKHFSAPLFTATTGVPLVPGLAPVEVDASVVGSVGFLVSGQLLPRGVAILVRPEASILATATASANAGIASARVEGQVELLTLSVPIQAALTYTEEDGLQFRWDVRVDLDADWLAGNIEVIASAFGQERYRKPLAEWEGFHINTTHMSNGAGEIFPGQPGECGDSASMEDLRRDDGVPQMLRALEAAEDDGQNPAMALVTTAVVDWNEAPLTQSFLAQDMREDPSTIPVVGSLARQADPEALVLIAALEEAGDAESQSELRGLVIAEDVEGASRRRAIAALGRVPVPTDETIELLQARFSADEGDRRTAGYALGTALSSRRPYDPAMVDDATVALEQAYEAAASDDDRVLMLQVLGNVGAHRTVPLLSRELNADNPRVRAEAAMALRHIGGDEAEALLEQVLHTDVSADVREAAVRAAEQRDTPAATRAIAEWIEREPDGWVQMAALHALGRSVTRSDDAAQALRRIEADAPMPQLRKVARNYLNRLDAEVE